MKRKFEIGIYQYWGRSGAGTSSSPFIPLTRVNDTEIQLELDIPLFNSEEEAAIWYSDLYKKEQDIIDTKNLKIKSDFKPNWLLSEPRLLENKLPKQIYLRECWVIE